MLRLAEVRVRQASPPEAEQRENMSEMTHYLRGVNHPDESIAEVVDANPPIELVSLSREINNNGYDLILAGEDRGDENIERCRSKIKQLTGEE